MTTLLQIIYYITLGQCVKSAMRGMLLAWILLLILVVLPLSPNFGLWTLIALFTVGLGGAAGGVFSSFFRHLAPCLWQKILVYSFCLSVYLTTFWIGIIVALNYVGLWN